MGIRCSCIRPKLIRRFLSQEKTENHSGPKEEEERKYEENIQSQILTAALRFVPQYGWTKDAISQGAETLGYAGVSHGMFPNAGADLINYFYVSSNKQLVKHMENITKEPDTKIIPQVFIEDAIQMRLRMIIPYIDKWPQAMGIMTMPKNVPVALANLLTLVDDICHFAGDKSVDFNWYTRRIALGGIYKMTELYMVQDKSEDYNETWLFLHRRMDEAMQISQVLLSSEELPSVTKETVLATFTTARNILRLNQNR